MESLDFVEIMSKLFRLTAMMQNTISTLPFSVTGRLKHSNWQRKCDCLPNSLYEKGIQQVFQLERVGGYPIGIVPYKYFKKYHSVGAK